MKKDNLPELRFLTFGGDWNQHKLGDLCDEFRSGKSIKAKDIQNEGRYPVLGGNGLRGYTNTYNHDGVYTLIGRQGALCGNMNISYGKAYFTEHAIAVKGNKNNDTSFLFYLLGKMNLGQYSGQSAQPGLAVNKLIELTAFTPNHAEQTKISEFFTQLDETISLHQQELDTLKQTKQGFLQKMFPTEGESLPEIRFQGFTENWKEIKAASIFQSVSDKNHVDLPVLSASQKEGMVFRDQIGIDIQYNADSIKTYKRVTPGQFVIHLRSFQGGFALSNIEGITSPAYTVLDFKDKETNSSLFWKNVLSSKNFIKRLETVTYGIRDGKSISFSDFSTLKFKVPTYEEQIQIGNFFKQFDELIVLQEKELDALKQTKKAFLQKMFV